MMLAFHGNGIAAANERPALAEQGVSMELELKVNGKIAIASDVTPREFSTGSVGLQLPGKVTINGQVYQTNIQLVAVGSKTADKAGKAAIMASLNAVPAK